METEEPTLINNNENAQESRTTQAPQTCFHDYLPGILHECLALEQYGGYEVQSAVDGEHPFRHGEEAVERDGAAI
jgi:hypothetical protein